MGFRRQIGCGLALFAAMAALLVPPKLFPQATPPVQTQPNTLDPHADDKIAAQKQALGFLQYLDQGRYADSYAYTSSLLRSKVSPDQYAQQVQRDRAPLGAVQSRHLTSATYTTSFQGVPPGQYIVLNYTTDFANKKDAAEILTMSYENGYWRVAGWNVRDIDSGQGSPQNQPASK